MKKHYCENCATETHLERETPWWATKQFHVLGRHIHTGNIKTIAHYNTEMEAAIKVQDLKKHCVSHDTFVVLKAQS